MAPDRRHCLRQKVNTPAFASFDGVTGGMILDLSEEGMAMHSIAPLEAHSVVPLHISLGEPAAYLETTGYVAWADALGRAGVRFSDLPEESRARLREWLTLNASTPSWKAPRWVVQDFSLGRNSAPSSRSGVSLSLETERGVDENCSVSTSVQYEFQSLTGDLSAALTLIVSRACSITRGTGAAVALAGQRGMTCRAVAGRNVPTVGSVVDISSGFSGECVRLLRSLRCDDTASDSHANAEACRTLEIRSVLGAPIVYERDLVGLLEVFSTAAYAFDDGDLAVVDRLAQTVVSTLSRAEAFQQE